MADLLLAAFSAARQMSEAVCSVRLAVSSRRRRASATSRSRRRSSTQAVYKSRNAAISCREQKNSSTDSPDCWILEWKSRRSTMTFRWRITVSLNGHTVTFAVDSGADVNILMLKTCRKLSMPPHERASTTLASVDTILIIDGKLQGTVTFNNSAEVFCVVDSAGDPLSRSVCSHLGVLQLTGEVNEDVPWEAGLMKTTPISIQLREDATRVALTTARSVPLPLMKPREPKKMERHGTVTSETKPADWISALAPVPKPKSNEARSTVDYKKLNQSVKRHTLPIPTLEQLTSKLSSATRFSKLDASSGFYQTPLDEASCKMTMFLAPFGRKRFLRLPMGISHAPECFQQKMEMLDGLP